MIKPVDVFDTFLLHSELDDKLVVFQKDRRREERWKPGRLEALKICREAERQGTPMSGAWRGRKSSASEGGVLAEKNPDR